MLSKRDRLYQAVEALRALRCPVCGADMCRAGDDFACGRGHRVNVNRRGCLNFLSQPVEGCYDAALFQARRRVFAVGCYRPVADAVERLLACGDLEMKNAPRRIRIPESRFFVSDRIILELV